MSQKDIFQNFEGAQNRKISSAPAGGSVPSSPVPSSAKTNLQSQTSTTPNSKDVIAYASANPSTETTRCADAFTEEQRKVMARFSNNNVEAVSHSSATMTRNKAMEMLLNKDRSRTSLLVAELRKDAERMRKNEERETEQNNNNNDDDDSINQGRRGKSSSQSPNQNARHASPAFSNSTNKGAVASSCDDDAKEIGTASPFDDFDESQLGRFSSLALESGAKQRLLEKCKRVEVEEKAERQHLKEIEAEEWKIVLVEIQFEMKSSLDFVEKNTNNSNNHVNESVEDSQENMEEDIISEIMSRNNSPTSNDTKQDGETITMLATATKKSRTNENSSNTAKRVTFSHLSSRRAGKMTQDAAAKIIQRQIRRFSSVASSQRFLSLLHLSNICASENKNTTSFRFSSPFPHGSVCSCPTTAKWLRNGSDGKNSQKHQQKFSLSCSSLCKSLPYHLQCLLAAALEYEVRLHSENLSQFYIAAEEEQTRKNRKGAKVSRSNRVLDGDAVNSGEDDDENQQDGEESNSTNMRLSNRSHHHSFKIFRKCLLPNEEAEEILNMIKTAVSGEEFYLNKLSSKSGIQEEHDTAISSDDDDEEEQNHSPETNNEDMSKLAARWVVDSLIPFASHSVCKVLGGSKTHETALDLIFSKKRDKSQQLVFYDTKSNSISNLSNNNNEINQNAEDKENNHPMKNSKSKDDNSRSSSIVAKLTGCTTYFLSLPTTGSDEWISHEDSINEDGDDTQEIERQREGMLEKMKKWRSTNDKDNTMNHDLSKLMHIVPEESLKSLVFATTTTTTNNSNNKNSVASENSSDPEKRKSTAELLEELRIDQEKLVASLPPVEGADHNNLSSSVVKRSMILSDDERGLLQDLGDGDPVIAEMLEHIENAEDEELRASQAEVDRKLSFALAIQKAAQASLKRMTAVSTGCGGDDDDDDGERRNDDVVFNEEKEGEANTKSENKSSNGKWLPVNDQVRKFGAVITSAATKNSRNENTKAENAVVKSMICVVCELDDDDTVKCQCGNYFHKDCGVRSNKNQSFNCCESCGKN